jgi:hypothetical protein
VKKTSPTVHRARRGVAPRVLLLFAVLLAGVACATPRPALGPDVPALVAPGFDFARDAFAFPNEVRASNPGVDGLYANYCFVLARGLRQFHRFARFEPTAPPLDEGEYAERVRQIVARPAWAPPPAEPVVIPGYAGLRDFSRAHEGAVKAGLGGPFWTWVHWTNWRVTFPVTRGHQERVLHEILADLRAGGLVQLLVTNWPVPELNHTLVAYEAHPAARGIELVVWDPNAPDAPGIVTFDREARRFEATRVHGTRPGPIRVFRMYYSRWL